MDRVENVGDKDSTRIFKEALDKGVKGFLETLVQFIGEGVDVSIEAKVTIRDVKSGIVPYTLFQVFGEKIQESPPDLLRLCNVRIVESKNS